MWGSLQRPCADPPPPYSWQCCSPWRSRAWSWAADSSLLGDSWEAPRGWKDPGWDGHMHVSSKTFEKIIWGPQRCIFGPIENINSMSHADVEGPISHSLRRPRSQLWVLCMPLGFNCTLLTHQRAGRSLLTGLGRCTWAQSQGKQKICCWATVEGLSRVPHWAPQILRHSQRLASCLRAGLIQQVP